MEEEEQDKEGKGILTIFLFDLLKGLIKMVRSKKNG